MKRILFSCFNASKTSFQNMKYGKSITYTACGLSLTVGGLLAYTFLSKETKVSLETKSGESKLNPKVYSSVFWASRAEGISKESPKLKAKNNFTKKERLHTKWVREIADELGLQIKTFSSDWIIVLESLETGKTKYIWGYSFGLNSQVASTLCSDKAALSDVLTRKGIPHIEHKIFLTPKLIEWTPETGTFEGLFLYAKKYNYNVVLKPKDGAGGRGVTHCKNRRDVENALLSLFSTDYGLAASPYEKINDEYRVIMLDNEPKFVFKKERLSVVGDGQKCLRELMIARLNDCPGELDDLIKLDNINKDMSLDEVPAEGEKVPVLWKHNLSAGAKASIDIENNLKEKICELAVKASTAVGIRFASVDIVTVGNDLKVMEINSGVTMEKMPTFILDGEKIAKSIYREVIAKMFDINNNSIDTNNYVDSKEQTVLR